MSPEQQARNAYQHRFGQAPHWIASAPGRVNLIGEFTDYNDGFVLPMALERRTAIATALNGTDRLLIYSDASPDPLSLDLAEPLEPDERGKWSNYPKGVLAQFARRKVTDTLSSLKGFTAVITSTVPIGAGLSSSAALEVAFATLLEALLGTRLDPIEKALLCHRAEHAFPGVPCGIMDPFITTLGRENHALLLDCRSHERIWLPLTDPTVSVLIINTKVKHQLANSAYPERREQCGAAARRLGVEFLRDASREQLEKSVGSMDALLYRRARHVITEIARTRQASVLIREREWREFGLLLDASHESLRYDFEVSCPELDAVIEIAHGIGRAAGVFGCRMTGGGFGGCAMALIETRHQDAIMDTIAKDYRARTGIDPELFITRAAHGAQLLEV